MAQGPTTDPIPLGRAGAEALRRGDFAQASLAFERASSLRPAEAAPWFGLALARRGLGDEAGGLLAIDRVLEADPSHLPALMMKADHFARTGQTRAAAAFYRAAVARTPAMDRLPPELQDEVRRAAGLSAAYARQYEIHLDDALSAVGFTPEGSSQRFRQSLDLLLGRKQIYMQSPKSFFFPELPHRQFYERGEFPWLGALEAQTRAIRDELLEVVKDEAAFRPYIQTLPNRPPNDYGALLDSLDWSAFFLIRSGEVVAENAARCPRTMAALNAVPLTQAPGRAPTVLFSLLKPGVRIPPHHGYVNTRLICHLPLIAPDGCGLRVGNETRPWIQGQTLVFDDTIEHEAWNDSDALRVVLLFEIWRPELTPDERDLVAALLAAVDSFEGAPRREERL